jgi:hypothetical protein
MKQNITQSNSNKLALCFLAIAAIFWLGGINIRAVISNELLVYDQFQFRTSIPPDRENTLFQLMSNASLVIIISYAVVLISAVWLAADVLHAVFYFCAGRNLYIHN